MKDRIHHLLFVFILTTPLMLQAESSQLIDDVSAEFSINRSLLEDFVNSYNFKCPDVISEEQLRAMLLDKYADHELNIMIESKYLNWRDTYVEARSNILCLTTGVVSKGY